MHVISDHTSSLYLFLIPPCPCWGTRTSRRPGAPAAPPRRAPWRPCGADRSSRASSHTPPARSRSGQRHLQQTEGTNRQTCGTPWHRPPSLCAAVWVPGTDFSTPVQRLVLPAQHSWTRSTNQLRPSSCNQKGEIKIQTHTVPHSHAGESQESSTITQMGMACMDFYVRQLGIILEVD